MPGRVRFRLFGGFSATSELPGAKPIRIASKHHRALLAYLIFRPDHAETRERLASLLWGDSTDQQARHNLRQRISTLRKELAEADADLIKGDRDTVALDGKLVTADALEFHSLIQSGSDQDLEQACALYAGEFLDGLNIAAPSFDTWQQNLRSRFRDDLAMALDHCIRRRDEAGDGEAAIGYATRLVALCPENEIAQRWLIDLLARNRGRTTALNYARTVEQHILSEFGCELEPETRALIDRIEVRSTETHKSVDLTPVSNTSALPDRTIRRDDLASEAIVATEPAGSTSTPPDVRTWPTEISAFARRLRPPTSRFSSAVIIGTGLCAVLALIGLRSAFEGAMPPKPPSGLRVAQDANWQFPLVMKGTASEVSRALHGQGASAIMVMPFTSDQPEPALAGKLARLLSDDLINTLSRIPTFRVISRSTSSRYDPRTADVAAIGTELGVQYVLEGSTRLEREKLQIHVALVDTRTRLQVWSDRYEHGVSEQVSVQDEIARGLARQLHVKLMEVRGRAKKDANPDLDDQLFLLCH